MKSILSIFDEIEVGDICFSKGNRACKYKILKITDGILCDVECVEMKTEDGWKPTNNSVTFPNYPLTRFYK